VTVQEEGALVAKKLLRGALLMMAGASISQVAVLVGQKHDDGTWKVHR
jgi:hypothetical protein